MEVEKYLEEQDLPYTVFQPQYIYGPYTNKDCEQWFMDRIIRCCRVMGIMRFSFTLSSSAAIDSNDVGALSYGMQRGTLLTF